MYDSLFPQIWTDYVYPPTWDLEAVSWILSNVICSRIESDYEYVLNHGMSEDTHSLNSADTDIRLINISSSSKTMMSIKTTLMLNTLLHGEEEEEKST